MWTLITWIATIQLDEIEAIKVYLLHHMTRQSHVLCVAYPSNMPIAQFSASWTANFIEFIR